jgi:tetratricopeptide (TPR) repeat protein
MPAGEFGETTELLCSLAFVAWRHSQLKESQVWVERLEGVLANGSVSLDCLKCFHAVPPEERSEELNRAFLSDAESLFVICATLREERNSEPAKANDEARGLFQWVLSDFRPVAFLEEKDYFLTQLAITVATCQRWLGRREECAAWLGIAEERNARTRNVEAGKSEIELVRLVGQEEMGRPREVIASLGPLQARLSSEGMSTALAQSEMLLAACLKDIGKEDDAIEPLKRALANPVIDRKPILKAYALALLADAYTILGSAEAEECFAAATRILREHECPTAEAWLGLVVGQRRRLCEDLDAALLAHRSARRRYEELGLTTWAAYARLLAAEVLLSKGRYRDAEDEIREALPLLSRVG